MQAGEFALYNLILIGDSPIKQYISKYMDLKEILCTKMLKFNKLLIEISPYLIRILVRKCH